MGAFASYFFEVGAPRDRRNRQNLESGKKLSELKQSANCYQHPPPRRYDAYFGHACARNLSRTHARRLFSRPDVCVQNP